MNFSMGGTSTAIRRITMVARLHAVVKESPCTVSGSVDECPFRSANAQYDDVRQPSLPSADLQLGFPIALQGMWYGYTNHARFLVGFLSTSLFSKLQSKESRLRAMMISPSPGG